jgi:RimK family alpha-L-glutamate ligase
MRVGVLGTPANEANEPLVSAWIEHGVDCALIGPEEVMANGFDLIVGRVDVRATLDGVEPGLLALLLAERHGVPVVNRAEALLATHDKLRTAALLRRIHLPHPATCHVRPDDLAACPRAPVVLKPRFGSWGRDVRLCLTDAETRDALEEFASRPWLRRHGVIAQEPVPTPGFDLRVLVSRGHVVGAIERRSQPGEWRTNVSVGADELPGHADAAARKLAIAAAAAVGIDLVGVDLMPQPDGGYVVIELNGAVDFDPLYLPGRDVYASVADSLGLGVRRPEELLPRY